MAASFRTSYSTRNLLRTCERKYQIIKIFREGQKEESEHLVFGSAFGVGAAYYLATQNEEQAIYEAWRAYWPIIETEKKNQTLLIAALRQAFSSLDDLLMDYELVSFQQKPAIELSFRIDIDEDYYEVGYLDAVLRHKQTGLHYTFECKHTGSNALDLDPMYKNSSQGLGYSIVLDQIAGEDQAAYGVIYFVAQIAPNYKIKIHTLLYEKTLLDRLNWFITLGVDIEYMKMLKKISVYPLRGDACMNYKKVCPFFGTCDLYSQDQEKEQELDTNVYQFRYNINEVIQNHLDRIKK